MIEYVPLAKVLEILTNTPGCGFASAQVRNLEKITLPEETVVILRELIKNGVDTGVAL